ncbi:iron-containing alcohol dehydrogenase [Thermosinus carboxydivorans Nor1]|uniref:Iron-containing alcohol dehydrogenase n=1 Tax=Thermosinus carboxydivorans Nor1 TaxID=401526 RepID=A1HRT6_9FIRM|nr:iron-containing alcohol dehydrogenase [Thermosinus carboxydivorans]EAX47257.1 iron-containing alcohol dehydrogenase [Thermosinus carboxydivorans Nor1]
MWEKSVDINLISEIRAKTTVYLGVGAIGKITDIAQELSKKGINKAVVVTGKSSHIKTGAWDKVKHALDAANIAYTLYSKVTPNPTVDQVDEAAHLARAFGAQAVIAIGGGSPIDAAKSVAILLEYTDKTARDIYEFKFTPVKAAPIVAINLTHGTGTEVDRFAVVSIPEKEYKPAIAYDCIYPLYAIDDPALMTMLPVDQTIYVTIDAVNHVVEAATTTVNNPFAISLARETIKLVAEYLPRAKQDPQDLQARYFLLYASLIAGISFDNGLLHFTHALEHPLSGVRPELAHGKGLGILLPAVVKQIYPAKGAILADILAPIIPGLTGAENESPKVYTALKNWLKSMGISARLADEGFTAGDIDKLVKLAFETPSLKTLLDLAPVPATPEVVRNIYSDAL